jgi:putative sigma-54 modulation protein
MTFRIAFKHLNTTEAIRVYAKKKTEKLTKYFHGRISVTWNFDIERQNQVAHCHLIGNHMDYFGEASTPDLYASIDLAITRIEKQLRKHKEVVKDHLHRNGHRLP